MKNKKQSYIILYIISYITYYINVCKNRNIQTLFIRIFQTKRGLVPPIIRSIDLKNFQKFEAKKKNCIFWFRNIKLPFSELMTTYKQIRQV